MPVFIEWKWEDLTQSLIAIFHFYDDFSKPNLRLVEYDEERGAVVAYPWKGEEIPPFEDMKRSWMTWAPSHPEMALLMQMLCYANIINGLKPSEKKEFWIELEGKKKLHLAGYKTKDYAVPGAIINEMGSDKRAMTYYDPKEDVMRTCAELCPEYIDYLIKILKAYLRT